MKALSLWQPWASAIAIGSKRIETRSWSTNYRGPLLIHAAKRKNISELIHLHSCWNWQGAMRGIGWSWARDAMDRDMAAMPFGAIVAICTLDDVRPTDSFTQAELDKPQRAPGATTDGYDWTERQMGNYALGRFGWVLACIQPLEKPIPFTGHQGLFNVPDELLPRFVGEK